VIFIPFSEKVTCKTRQMTTNFMEGSGKVQDTAYAG